MDRPHYPPHDHEAHSATYQWFMTCSVHEEKKKKGLTICIQQCSLAFISSSGQKCSPSKYSASLGWKVDWQDIPRSLCYVTVNGSLGKTWHSRPSGSQARGNGEECYNMVQEPGEQTLSPLFFSTRIMQVTYCRDKYFRHFSYYVEIYIMCPLLFVPVSILKK